MVSITRLVDNLTQPERQVYEAVLGRELHAGQKVLLQLIEDEAPFSEEEQQPSPSHQSTSINGAHSPLPEWCDVFRGLSDEEIDAVDKAILSRSHTSRQVDLDL